MAYPTLERGGSDLVLIHGSHQSEADTRERACAARLAIDSYSVIETVYKASIDAPSSRDI